VNEGVLFSHKEEWNSVICSKINGIGDIILSEISLTERHVPHVLSHMWKLKQKSTRLQNINWKGWKKWVKGGGILLMDTVCLCGNIN
jgi:hypothetical protein